MQTSKQQYNAVIQTFNLKIHVYFQDGSVL